MSDIATLLEAIAALIGALFWPAVALAAILLFRGEISELLGRIRRGVIMGQEIELDELDRSATAAESEAAALPRSFADVRQSQVAEQEQVVRRILDEAAKSPRAALLVLTSEMEREVNELLASSGWLDGKRYVPFREAIQMLHEQVALPGHIPGSVELFWDVRNHLVHGGDASDEDVFRALDSGITILRALQALPIETHVVYHPGVEVYGDPEGQEVRIGVRAVILETESPSGVKTHRVFPTRSVHFQKGKRVAWEWNLDSWWDESWYRDPDTQDIRAAWGSAAEFIGRHVEDLERPEG